MKVWLLTNSPSSYQVEFFRMAHQPGVLDLDVRFMRLSLPGEPPFQPGHAGFPCSGLHGFGLSRGRDEMRFHPSAVRDAAAGRHDAYVLSGLYTSPTFLACAAALRRRGAPWAAWLERPWPDDAPAAWDPARPGPRWPVFRRLRRHLLSRLAAISPRLLCVGTLAVEAYAALGAPRSRLRLLPYHCDVARFGAPASGLLPPAARRAAEFPGTVFLFSGQMIPRKGVDVLLSAFRALAERRPDVYLLLLGDGPGRAGWEASIPPALRGRVEFAGRVAQAELPACFQAADAFVLPSRHDGWGVVVQEACGAGLPVIAASTVGAAADLVEDGQSGFVVPPGDAVALLGRMEFLADRPDRARQFGARSREIGHRFAPAEGARRLCGYLAELIAEARGA